MAINIKDPETDRLAREVANKAGDAYRRDTKCPSKASSTACESVRCANKAGQTARDSQQSGCFAAIQWQPHWRSNPWLWWERYSKL